MFRKVEEAKPDHPEAERALAWIGALYEIDARAEGDIARCGELRRAESTAILADFKTWLWELATLTSISIGKAAAYAIANWDRLTRFVDDARIPLDNNATERAIRGPVVGRKNHYGSKSRSGTQVAATLYTILETAKLHGIDPAAYLAAAITAAGNVTEGVGVGNVVAVRTTRASRTSGAAGSSCLSLEDHHRNVLAA